MFVDLMDYPFETLTKSNGVFSLDTETLGDTRETNIPIYFSYASREFGKGGGPTTTEKGFAFLRALCESPLPHVFQNAKFDLFNTEKHLGFAPPPAELIEDTILMHCLLDEHHLGHHKLKVLSRELLGHPRLDELELKKEHLKCKYNTRVPQQKLHEYAVCDAEDTLDLYYLFKPQLEEQHLWGHYRMMVEAEMVYLDMFKRGVALDQGNLEKALEGVLSVLHTLSERVWEAFGEKFLISSPRQLGDVLSKHFPLTIKTTSEDWCTDKDALEPFRADPKMQILLAWKYVDKARQYLQGYEKRAVNSRLHSEYRQTTITGRSASSDPNLENIPKQRGRVSETEVGDAQLAKLCADAFRRVRACLCADPGAKLLSFDYKQIEYRCFAFYSGSERLIAALERGEDFHSFVCRMVFGEETEQLRYMTKIINYGRIYGMGEALLIIRLKIYHPRPEIILAQHNKMLPEMCDTQRRLKEVAKARGYLIDPFGRRYRYLPERPHAVVAWVCQGTGTGSIKKWAMVKTKPILRGRRSGLVLEIHDDLIFEMFPEDAYLAIDLKAAMEDFHQLGRIPVLVDASVGPNLLDLKEVSIEEAVEYLKGG